MFSYIMLSIEWIFYFERLYFLSVRTDVEPVNKDGVFRSCNKTDVPRCYFPPYET